MKYEGDTGATNCGYPIVIKVSKELLLWQLLHKLTNKQMNSRLHYIHILLIYLYIITCSAELFLLFLAACSNFVQSVPQEKQWQIKGIF